ncbi:MAG TPA: lipid-A-disaccharide synthase [Gammaproteobacteria bacterium]|nr:lipid-A-disaccharide synthase [Gammaproteobacteria bacterium]
MSGAKAPVRIAISAGESSGDTLGAGLIRALKASVPGVGSLDVFGIAGPAMRAAGCEAWYRSEALSVMGLAEVLRHLPRLLRLRSEFAERLLSAPPDVFCGIDSPDFNLPLARRLKSAGIRTVQYVSPQVWAWRQSRVKTIAKSVDEVLCLLPFETDFYAEHGVAARFVGHPLADEIPLDVDRAEARAGLGLAPDRPLLALLPGSRRSEVSRLAQPFAETAEWLTGRVADLGVAVAIAHEGLSDEWAAHSAGVAPAGTFACYVGRAREVMSAADVVLTASGTASLEAMLLRRPMVVAYRMSAVSYWLFSRMGIQKLPFYSLPNLLAGRELAAEYVQGEVRADVLGPALLRCFDRGGDERERDALMQLLHERLRRGASARAAEALLTLAGSAV